jgi:preprotein translocase SecE subunit
MKKVSWPGRQEVVGTTIVVIVAVFFFGLYLGLVDYLLAMGLDRVLRYFHVTGGA